MSALSPSAARLSRQGWAQARRSPGLLPSVLVLCLGLLPMQSVLAAEFLLLEDECRGRQLMIKGLIEPGDADRFRARLAGLVTSDQLPDVQDAETLWTVKLDSPGGDLQEAMRIGALLRDGLATTETSYRYARRPDGVYDFEPTADTLCLEGEGALAECFPDVVKAECAGACLLIWLAGADRYAHEGKLGVHGISATAETQSDVAAYLARLEVPETQISEWLAGRVETAWLSWPERKMLAGRSSGLEGLVRDCPAGLTPEESLDSVMHPDPGTRDRLMDRAEAHRDCRLARLRSARSTLVEALQNTGVSEP